MRDLEMIWQRIFTDCKSVVVGCDLDLSGTAGGFDVKWFNPRKGGELQMGSVESVNGGGSVSIGSPPDDAKDDWLAVIRKK